MSNYIKYNYVQAKPDTVARVINSNPKMEEVLKEYHSHVTVMPQGEEGQDDSESEGGFEAGISAEVVDLAEQGPSPEECLQAAQEEAERILSEARENAQGILDQAQAQADQLREEEKAAGFAQGQQEASEAMEAQKAEMESQLAEKQQSLEDEYSQKHALMEGEIVEAIAQVLENNFGLLMDNRQEVLLYLIRRTIYGIESSKNFKVRVAPENVSNVSQALGEFASGLGSDVTVDVTHDDSLDETGCIIETEYGLYHCGIDTQLSNLLAQMKALSQ